MSRLMCTLKLHTSEIRLTSQKRNTVKIFHQPFRYCFSFWPAMPAEKSDKLVSLHLSSWCQNSTYKTAGTEHFTKSVVGLSWV